MLDHYYFAMNNNKLSAGAMANHTGGLTLLYSFLKK